MDEAAAAALTWHSVVIRSYNELYSNSHSDLESYMCENSTNRKHN